MCLNWFETFEISCNLRIESFHTLCHSTTVSSETCATRELSLGPNERSFPINHSSWTLQNISLCKSCYICVSSQACPLTLIRGTSSSSHQKGIICARSNDERTPAPTIRWQFLILFKLNYFRSIFITFIAEDSRNISSIIILLSSLHITFLWISGLGQVDYCISYFLFRDLPM